MKKIMMVLAMVLFMAGTALADYTVDLKNESGVVIRTYIITTNQIAHLQKKATRDNTTVIKLFEGTISDLIMSAKATNAAMWRRANEAYIEAQSRQ